MGALNNWRASIASRNKFNWANFHCICYRSECGGEEHGRDNNRLSSFEDLRSEWADTWNIFFSVLWSISAAARPFSFPYKIVSQFLCQQDLSKSLSIFMIRLHFSQCAAKIIPSTATNRGRCPLKCWENKKTENLKRLARTHLSKSRALVTCSDLWLAVATS